MTAADSTSVSDGPLTKLGYLVGRSLFPIVGLALILGTLLWGPWVTLVLTYVWWRIVTIIG